MNIDWESLGKRLIGLNMIGFRIEQDSGHRRQDWTGYRELDLREVVK